MRIVFRDVATGKRLATVTARAARAIEAGNRKQAAQLERLATELERAAEDEAEALEGAGYAIRR